MKEHLEILEKELKSLFKEESSGHDFYHLQRTMNLALKIQEKEGGDRLIIGIAAILHDIHRLIQYKTGKFCTPKDSLLEVSKILSKLNIKESQKEKILHCIEFHEEYNFTGKGVKVEDIETLVIQDADNLDAIGAIGIGRTFQFSGAYKIPMWEPEIPFYQNDFTESKYDASTLHHFYNKLFRLKDNMNTQTAKKMAERRIEFMQNFVEEFMKEWKGKL